MNKKKIVYISFTLIIFIIGYFNYFYIEKEIEKDEKIVVTEDVYYKSKDYTVEAKKQLDYLNSSEIVFNQGKTNIKDVNIYGNNILIDKERNMFIKDKIVGSSSNGWEFNTDELNYEKEKDLFKSEKHIVLENNGKNIKIEGDIFESNSDMSFITIERNFVFYKENVKISSTKAEYSAKDNSLKFIENIKVEILDNDKMKGNFKSLLYNITKGNFLSEDNFIIDYDGASLESNHISFNDENQELLFNNEVIIKKDNSISKAKNGYKAPGSELIVFNNSVTLKENIQILEAEKYTYNLEDEKFILSGNAKYTEKDSFIIESDRIEQLDNMILFIGEDKDVKITSINGVILTKNALYNKTEEKLFSTVEYIYNDGKSSSLRGNRFEYFLKNGLFYSFGDTKYKTSKMELETSDLNLDSFGKVKIDNPYKIESLESGAVLNGKSAVFNNITKDFISDGEVLIEGEDFTLIGKSLVYNTIKDTVYLYEPFKYKNIKEDLTITGDTLTITENKIVKVKGSGNIILGDSEIHTEKFEFDKSKSLITFPDNILYSLDNKKTSGTVKNGSYLTDKNIFTGNLFFGKNEQTNFKGDEVKIFKENNKIELYKNAEIKTEDFTLNSEEIIYHLALEKISSSKYMKIKNSKFDLDMDNGSIILNKKITGNKATLNIEKMYEFKGDQFDLDFIKSRILFENNTNGSLDMENSKTIFNADKTEILIKKTSSGYDYSNLNLFGNAKLYNEQRELSSNNIFFDKLNNTLIAKGNSILKIKDSNSEVTDVLADSIKVFLTEKNIDLEKNVSIKNKNNNKINFEIESENSYIDQKNSIITFKGGIIFKQNDKEVSADEGSYNFKTKNVNAKGNIRIKYIR